MTTFSPTAPPTYYRPRKYVRPLRRQLPVFWLIGGVVFVGLICLAIAWRNLSHEQMERDVAVQWSKIERLDKEIAHTRGKIKTETAHNRIAKWAKEQHGWRALPVAPAAVVVPSARLTASAMQEAAMVDTIHE